MVTKDLLTQLYDSLPVNIALISDSNLVLYANDSWQRSLDKYAAEHIFSGENEVWPSVDLPQKQLLQELSIAIHKAQTEGASCSNIRSDIRILNYQHNLTFSITPFVLNEQTVTMVTVHVVMDILSGGIAPALLSRDEANVFNSLLEGVVIQDSKGVITANNPASEAILGLTSEQMRGVAHTDPKWGTILENGEPCLPEQHPSAIAINTGKPVLNFTMGILNPDGRVRWLKINSQPIFAGKAKTPHMTVTSFVDITDERIRQKALTQLSSKLQLAMDAAQIGVWEYAVDSQRLIWDEAMFQIFDMQQSDFKGVVADFECALHPEDRAKIIGEFNHAISQGCSLTSEFRIIQRNDDIRHIYVAAINIQGQKGESDVYIGINRDITDEKKAKDKIQQSRDRLLDFVSSMPVAVFSVEGESVIFNKRAELITGYESEEIATVQGFFSLLFTQGLRPTSDFFHSVNNNTELLSRTTMQIVRRDREIRWVEFTGCKLEDRQAWVMMDVTEQLVAEKDLKKLAYFDTLTHLHNRTAIENRLIRSINRAKRNGTKLGLLVIDLDSFKNINDTYGHPAGDQLLIFVAQRLKNRVRDTDVIGRMGGDEFMVILENVENQKQLLSISNEFLACFNDPIRLEKDLNILLNVSVSIGASMFPEHGKDYVHLFRNADTALYKAKALGKNRAQIYLEEFTDDLRSRLSLEQRIEQALDDEKFELNFQPIVDCVTNKVVSVECLTRWHDPELGQVSPAKFIAVAESSGQIIRLGLWVLKNACQQFVRWQILGIDLNYIAVNLSPVQLNDSSLVTNIQQIIDETQISPNKLVLEITEGVLVHNQPVTKNILIELKRMGVKLAIDDFGTGYSSLAYLKYFNVDILKIDQSFIADISVDPVDAQITGAIISMAKSLKLRVVAEGVETQQQLDFIQQHQCHTYQGFLKSPALKSEHLVTLLKQE